MRLKVRLAQDANMNSVLTEEIFEFQHSGAKIIRFTTSQPQDFSPSVLGRTAIFIYEDVNGCADSWRASSPYSERGGCGQKKA
jgi:hypothetical protein